MSEQAKRITDYDSGETVITYWKDTDRWFINFPDTDLLGNLSNHKVEEHEDGTISVTPSIKVWNGRGAERHGFLTRGVWNEC